MLSCIIHVYVTNGSGKVLGPEVCRIQVPTGTVKGWQRIYVLLSAVQTLHKVWAGECQQA